MKEDKIRQEVEEDLQEDLQNIWSCDKCGNERAEYSGWDVDEICDCGGHFEITGVEYV